MAGTETRTNLEPCGTNSHLMSLQGVLPEQLEEIMQDVLWILVTIAFFVLSIGYVRFCDRVK